MLTVRNHIQKFKIVIQQLKLLNYELMNIAYLSYDQDFWEVTSRIKCGTNNSKRFTREHSCEKIDKLLTRCLMSEITEPK